MSLNPDSVLATTRVVLAAEQRLAAAAGDGAPLPLRA